MQLSTVMFRPKEKVSKRLTKNSSQLKAKKGKMRITNNDIIAGNGREVFRIVIEFIVINVFFQIY